MITEDYVSYEVAKLLKEKGFTQRCSHYYINNKMFEHCYQEVIPKNKEIVECPTQAMAMKWLREVHNVFIEVSCGYKNADPKGKEIFYDYDIIPIKGKIINWNNYLNNDFIELDTYEDSCESAIKYCLENLI